MTGRRREDWKLTSAAGLGVSTADRRHTAVGQISTEVQCREQLGNVTRLVTQPHVSQVHQILGDLGDT